MNAVRNPVDQFHISLLPRKAITARGWLEGMLGKAVKKGAGREPTPLPGPGVLAAGGQAAWAREEESALPSLLSHYLHHQTSPPGGTPLSSTGGRHG